jgi:hypothetical protein
VDEDTLLSDALLRQIIAVGQLDVLVGLPTLNNAPHIRDVVRAVHVSFARDFPRERTALVNSDGGSTDGTPDLVRSVSLKDGETLVETHALRTTHRVLAPYHGMPGRRPALRTIFAAADLTRAKVVVVLDPNGPTTRPDLVRELIVPVLREGAEFLAPKYVRHPRDGVLVTQLVRPLVRAAYGARLDEPLGQEFACSARFASACLDDGVWQREVARAGIDLWLRTTALARSFRVGQIWRPPQTAPPPAAPRASLAETVQQVLLALFDVLGEHEPYWRARTGVEELPAWGTSHSPDTPAPSWDVAPLAAQARQGVRDLRPVLEGVLAPATLSALTAAVDEEVPAVGDDTWVAAVYDFMAASKRRAMRLDHLAQAFVPVYLARAAAFLGTTEAEPAPAVEARLEALAGGFESRKPYLVERWTGG